MQLKLNVFFKDKTHRFWKRSTKRNGNEYFFVNDRFLYDYFKRNFLPETSNEINFWKAKTIDDLQKKSDSERKISCSRKDWFFIYGQVFFQDVFAEPDGSHSIDGVWRTSFNTFVATKYWCYRIITAICGVPTAILCGIYFACLSFDYIWCIMPCLRAYVIELQCLGKLFSLCVRTFFDPFFESVGRIFGGMRISHAREDNKPFSAW